MKPSSIRKLPKQIRETVDAAIREGRASIDDIVDMIKGMGADVSRSAVGRYRKKAEEQFQEFREAQEMAKVWATKATEEPEGDVGILVGQLLRVVALQTVEAMHVAKGDEECKPAKPMDVMLLAKGLEHLTKSDATRFALIVKIREQTLIDAAKAASASAKKAGLTGDVIRQIEEEILRLQTR
jgi:DNA-directed RNA polymerase specialized sigma54-like protein